MTASALIQKISNHSLSVGYWTGICLWTWTVQNKELNRSSNVKEIRGKCTRNYSIAVTGWCSLVTAFSPGVDWDERVVVKSGRKITLHWGGKGKGEMQLAVFPLIKNDVRSSCIVGILIQTPSICRNLRKQSNLLIFTRTIIALDQKNVLWEAVFWLLLPLHDIQSTNYIVAHLINLHANRQKFNGT